MTKKDATRTSEADDAVPDSAPRRSCPVCGAPITDDGGTQRRPRPFCSRICADVDLLRWLRGGYVIAGPDAADDEDGEAGRGPPEGGGAGA